MSLPVAVRLVALLRQRAETLATAESLTGGLIGGLLTGVPGASAVYRGGVISYATDLKATLAGVSELTLAQHGPVAEATAREMAAGVAQRCGADWGLSVTGVAGPDRQDGHPVGQVFVGIWGRGDHAGGVHELQLSGDRDAIRRETTQRALSLLERALGMPPRPADVD